MQSIQLIVLASLLVLLHAAVEFTNVQCTSLGKEFCDFEHCFLKSVNRSYKYMTMKVNLFKLPITNVTINFKVMKKANGYKPFLYNITFDGCKFFSMSKRNIVVQYFYSWCSDYTNMNHTCPYDHDVTIEKLPISHANNMVTNILPVPPGEYAVFSTWFAYNIPRATFNVFLKIF